MKNKNIQPDNPNAIEPRNNCHFFGNAHAEKTLMESFQSGKMPNAWLISGKKGVGKATLAYRFARFLLSNSKDAFSLHVDEHDYAFEQISNKSNPNLMVLESDVNSDSATSTIKVEDTRKINSFLRMTASEAKYRIVLIDSADQMNSSSANAILKLLEEPPKDALFLLVSHSPGKLLPTIRSRCRSLKMHQLNDKDMRSSVNLSIDNAEIDHPDVEKSISLAKGSAGVALDVYQNSGISIYKQIIEIMQSAPNINFDAIHKLAGDVSRKTNIKQWEIFCYLIREILSEITKSKALTTQSQLLAHLSLDDLIAIWEKTNSMLADVERINLDKKAVLLNIFGSLQKYSA